MEEPSGCAGQAPPHTVSKKYSCHLGKNPVEGREEPAGQKDVC